MLTPDRNNNRTKGSRLGIFAAAGLIVLASLTAPASLTASAATTAVMSFGQVSTSFRVDGQPLKALAYSADGTLMVQLKPIAEAMGYTIDYQASTGDLTLSKPRRIAKLIINNSSYSLNGLTSSAKTPFVLNGSTYVPLRHLANLSGYTIAIQGNNTYILTARPENEVTISASDELAVMTQPYSFSIHYPVLTGWHNAEAMNKVNQFLKDTAEAWKARAEQELMQAWAAYPNKDKIIDYAHIYPFGLQVTWTVASNEKGLLSLYADTYQYMGDIKRDKSIRYSWTFDLATGELLTLEQAVGDNPDARTRINQIINLIIASGEAEGFYTSDFSGIETAGTGWYLQDGRIVVYAQQPAIDAHSKKIPEIRIPIPAVK